MHDDWLCQLKDALYAAAHPERATYEKRYLKSDDVFLGVSVPVGHRLAKEFTRAHPDILLSDVRRLAYSLWASQIHEEKRLAVQLLDAYCSSITRDDWPLLASWLRQAGSWDLIDEISAHLLGSLAERYPELEADFDLWVTDADRWVRRAALVSHVQRLRHGTVSPARVRELCMHLVSDTEYFVQKALGWILRECAVQDPHGTVAFLLEWNHALPRMVPLEAVRKLDPQMRQHVLG